MPRPYSLNQKTVRRLYRLAVSLAALATAWGGWSLRRDSQQPVVVRQVIDGDTFELRAGQRVRCLGIDTPELERRTASGWVKVNEPFAQEARRFTEDMVLNKPVRLEYDVRREDKYGRLLAYCFVKQGDHEIMLQSELLRQGLAYFYILPPNVKYVDELVASLKEAKARKRGLWSLDLAVASADAARFIGERKIVEGQVRRIRKSEKVISLVMEGLRIVIFTNELELFKREGIDPAAFYAKKQLRVFGLIKEYRGAPEIVVSNPWQIEVMS